MITLKKILSDIRNIATSGSNTVDFRIEDQQIIYWIHQIRAMLISQDLSNGKDVSDFWLQTIACLGLIQVDSSECCDTNNGCMILRTSIPIPNTIESNSCDTIIRIESVNGKLISRTSAFASKYDNFSKYTSKKAKWFEKDRYIYIINDPYINKINVVGIFDDPTELADYVNCEDDVCYDDDDFYPISSRMASKITDIIVKTKILPFIQMPKDDTNNANNDFKQQIK